MPDVLKITPDRNNQVPICPHCGKPMDELRYFTGLWTFTVNYIFACPHCLRALGVGTQ
jgi:ribosomal protein L37AE/L43A